MKSTKYTIKKMTKNILFLPYTLVLFSTFMMHTIAQCAESIAYEKHDMSFQYLPNWEITDESGWFESPYVFLETQNSGLIMINQFKDDQIKTLTEHASDFSLRAKSMNFMGDFKTASIGPFVFEGFTGLEEKLTFKLNHKDIKTEERPMVRYYFRVESKNKVAVIILQSDTDDDLSESLAGLSHVLKKFKLTND